MADSQSSFGRRGGGRGGRPNSRGRRGGYSNLSLMSREGTDEKTEKKHWRIYCGFKRLQEFTEKDSNEILVNLTQRPDSLKDALDDTEHDEKMIALLLTCCAKACKCSSLNKKKLQLLNILKNSEFIQVTLYKYLIPLKQITPTSFEIHEKPLLDILSICLDMKQAMPNTVFLLHGLTENITGIYQALKVNYCYENRTIDLALEKWKTAEEKPLNEACIRKTETTFSKDEDKRKPPEHFGTIPVFPDAADLNMDTRPFLRPNKERGGYQDLDHYLDVQFRLLREDFIAPLREGVQEYRKAIQSSDTLAKFRNMKIYTEANVISPICQNAGLCHEVQFTCQGFSRIRWETSKRLIFGSLLCISTDDFETFSFATVVNRDEAKNGIIVLNFEKGANSKETVIPKGKFVMAETSAYFEAYRHVLQSLKNIQPGELPFEKYIVACDAKVSAPVYFTKSPKRAALDLRPLVDDSIVIQDETQEPGGRLLNEDDCSVNKMDLSTISQRAREISALNPSSWPEPELLRLDTSQYRALQQALTNEFVLIQGPPGTGKTYVGLKITKALLHNHSLWNYVPESGKQERRPILVVCYTNHALDQFLEGILEFYKGDVIRVGGRISTDSIQHYSIKNRRMAFRQSKALPKPLHQEKLISRERMDTIKLAINELAERVKNARLQIVHEDCMSRVIGNQHFKSLIVGYDNLVLTAKAQGSRIKWNSAIAEWLGFGQLSRATNNVPTIPDAQINVRPQHNSETSSHELVAVIDEVQVEMDRRQMDTGSEDGYEIRYSDKSRTEVRKMLENMGLQRKAVVHDIVDSTTNNNDENESTKQEGNVGEWEIQPKEKKRLKNRIRAELSNANKMEQQEAAAVQNVWVLTQEDRWRLYRYWIQSYCNVLLEKIAEFEDEFENACQAYAEIQIQEDKEIMKSAAVIGMTTTGAAKYQSVLKDIGPRIIIVEEAAEVLEAHIIATLSHACQHLILIGDHQQLKPTPTVYQLALKYNLEVSLFERMINNKVEYRCLQYQHRMRPEISQIARIIYPELKNHEVVNNYNDVMGIAKNIFLINHSEMESTDDEIKSHSNSHEATYIASLCRYLLQQGYAAKEITVLTLYSGQLYCIKQHMPKSEFEGVRVTVVDNYQGEENDIILLSLVRSNDDNKIGFVKTENRICVALSRAKIGLYVIGNFDLFENNSELWNKIVSLARKEGFIGDGLSLYCQNHPTEGGICAKKAEDFNEAPEGGCMKPCRFRLECGHICAKVCHVIDMDHEFYECQKPCTKTVCNLGHLCTGVCGEKCAKCMVLMPKIIPKCEHLQEVPCSIEPEAWMCTDKCCHVLPCGHNCQRICGESHTDKCTVKLLKTWESCGHKLKIPCYKSTSKCLNPCSFVLDCGHACTGTCGQCYHEKMHKPCNKRCNKALICGHLCTEVCSTCRPCYERCQTSCSHSKCAKSCGEPCTPCLEECTWKCPHYKCSKKCFEPCDRPRCNKPCPKQLKCGHACIGICGEICPNMCGVCQEPLLFRITKGKSVYDTRFIQLEDCKHLFDVQVLDEIMINSNNFGLLPIKLKCCPVCTIPIRRSNRYGNMVKSSLVDIEKVKEKMWTTKDTFDRLTFKLQHCRFDMSSRDSKFLFDNITSKEQTKENWPRNVVDTLEYQIGMLSKMSKIHDKFEQLSVANLDAMNSIDDVRGFITKPRTLLTKQERLDVAFELERLCHLQIFLKMKELNVCTQLAKKTDASFTAVFDRAFRFLTDDSRYDEKRKTFVKKFIGILEDQRVLPVGLKTEELFVISFNEPNVFPLDGMWLKCPIGHIFYKNEDNKLQRCKECTRTIRDRRFLEEDV